MAGTQTKIDNFNEQLQKLKDFFQRISLEYYLQRITSESHRNILLGCGLDRTDPWVGTESQEVGWGEGPDDSAAEKRWND